jgi:hypothetical protein
LVHRAFRGHRGRKVDMEDLRGHRELLGRRVLLDRLVPKVLQGLKEQLVHRGQEDIKVIKVFKETTDLKELRVLKEIQGLRGHKGLKPTQIKTCIRQAQ